LNIPRLKLPKSAKLKISNGIITILEKKVNLAQCSIYNFSHVFGGGWGGGGDETFPEFAESFAKILAKFNELKISIKTQH